MTANVYRSSVLMIIVGGALLSLLGIGMRLMDNPISLQILFYRSITQFLFLATVVLVMHRNDFVAQFTQMGSKGFLTSVLLAAAGVFMVTSLAHTTVANAVFIISLAPICSALLGKVFLNEMVSQRTWLAMSIALIGIVIIFSDGISNGGIFGMFLALMMMLCYSCSIITIRSQTGANTIAVCALYALILTVCVFPLVGDFSISNKDLFICIGLGVVQIGLGMLLIVFGAQYVPAAQVSILGLTEVILSPIWVWVFAGEVPTVYSLMGGAIVLFGVVLQATARRQ